MENISVILFTVNRSQLLFLFYLKIKFSCTTLVFKNRMFIGFNYETSITLCKLRI